MRAKAIPSTSAIVVAIHRNVEREESAMSVGTLFYPLLRLIRTEVIGDNIVVLVDTSLHLRTSASTKHCQRSSGEQRSGDLGRAALKLHGVATNLMKRFGLCIGVHCVMYAGQSRWFAIALVL